MAQPPNKKKTKAQDNAPPMIYPIHNPTPEQTSLQQILYLLQQFLNFLLYRTLQLFNLTFISISIFPLLVSLIGRAIIFSLLYLI